MSLLVLSILADREMLSERWFSGFSEVDPADENKTRGVLFDFFEEVRCRTIDTR